MEMIRLKIAGFNMQEIAEQFRCSYNTVQRSIQYGEREGLVRQYENQIIADLVPAALKVYMKKLNEDEDPFVAKHIIDVVTKMGERFEMLEQRNNEAEQSLAQYLDGLREQEDENVIDINSTAIEAAIESRPAPQLNANNGAEPTEPQGTQDDN